MKISFIAESDFANVLTEYSQCLNKHSGDIQSKSICYRPHRFKYNVQHDYDLGNHNEEQILEAKKWVEDSDIIIFGEEFHPLEPTYRTLREFSNLLGIDLINSDKKLCIWHPGSHYRQNVQFYNHHPLRDRIHKHLYAIDLYRLSPKNPNDHPIMPYHYIDFDINQYASNFKNKLITSPRTILHIPSNTDNKGTNIVNSVINNLQFDPKKFKYKVLTGVPYSEVIKEKKDSLFYIDQFAPNLTGGIGIAAFEGIMHSNLTFACTNLVGDSIPLITGEYSSPVIDLGETVESMGSTLNYYLNLGDSELIDIITAIGQWMEKYYSPEFIINHLIEIVKNEI